MKTKYDLYSLLVEKSIRCHGPVSEPDSDIDGLPEVMTKVCAFLEQINQQRLNTVTVVDDELEDVTNEH